MRLEAVAFDLDDTLLRDDQSISDYTIKVLHFLHDKGIRIIPVSGRTGESMRGFVERIDCADFYIAANGADLWSKEHVLLDRITLPPSLMESIAAFCNEFDCYVQTYDSGCFFYNREGVVADTYAQKSMLKGIYTPDFLRVLQVPRIKMIAIDSEDKIQIMYRKALESFSHECAVTCSKPIYLEFNPLNATKGKALLRAAEKYCFSIDHLIAFGDGINDLSMLQTAGHGIAMKNAQPEVFKYISQVCASNEEDGVAHYLMDLLPEVELND